MDVGVQERELPLLLALPLAFVWVALVTNVYNFMDGIDGLAASQAVIAGAALSIAGTVVNNPLVSIGGGLIVNGDLYCGHNLTAGEIGHMVIEINGPKCGCGNRGCLEALASRTAIFRKIEAAVKDGQATVLTDLVGKDLKDMRSGDLRKAIRRGDKFVAKVIEEAAEFAGIGVANLINILNPEMVVVGGGVIEALQDEMMPTLVKTAKEHAMPGTMAGIEIKASRLGDNAGITGAAVLARRGSAG